MSNPAPSTNFPAEQPGQAPQEFLAALEDFFSDLEYCSGVQISLHDYTYITRHSLPLRRYAHHSDYCRRVKSNPCLERLCRKCDVEQAADEAAHARGPFLRYCHAGVCEVLVPIKDNENRLLALVFCGQVFSAERGFPPESDPAWTQNAPLVSEKNVWAVARVVDQYFRINRSLTVAISDFNRPLAFTRKSMAKAIRIIETRYREKLTIHDLAREVGLSVSRFEHLFKQETGTSFTEALRHHRLHEAANLLSHTDLRVTEIARHLGFEDPGYFHRLFKRQEKLTPLAYRQKSRRSPKLETNPKSKI